MSNRKLNRESPSNPEQFSLTKAINEHRQKKQIQEIFKQIKHEYCKKKSFFLVIYLLEVVLDLLKLFNWEDKLSIDLLDVFFFGFRLFALVRDHFHLKSQS